jgi:hypothetical protein
MKSQGPTTTRTGSKLEIHRTHSKWMACGLLWVALLLILAPAAQGANATTTARTIRAPFTGATFSPSIGTSSAGCGMGSVPVAPSFDPNTGRSVFSVKAHANACGGPFGDSGSAFAEVAVSVPITIHHGDTHVRARAVISASLASWIGSSSCQLNTSTYSYCYSVADADLSGYAYIFDVTTSQYVAFTSTYWPGAFAASSVWDECYQGMCYLNVTGNQHIVVADTVVWSFNVSGVKPSNAYSLVLILDSSISVSDSTYQASPATGSEGGYVSMATSGMGATLIQIAIV